jgi:hypothetical protein
MILALSNGTKRVLYIGQDSRSERKVEGGLLEYIDKDNLQSDNMTEAAFLT